MDDFDRGWTEGWEMGFEDGYEKALKDIEDGVVK